MDGRSHRQFLQALGDVGQFALAFRTEAPTKPQGICALQAPAEETARRWRNLPPPEISLERSLAADGGDASPQKRRRTRARSKAAISGDLAMQSGQLFVSTSIAG